MIRSIIRKLVPLPVRRGLRRMLRQEDRHLRLRAPGYRALRGVGIEIGALDHPAGVPEYCRVTYLDAITPEEAKRRFPEIDHSQLVRVDHVVDLDTDGLSLFPDNSQDFAIASHVIEHVANPARLVAEMTRVLRTGGRLVIAAPDRDFTFDRRRPLTPLDTLHKYYVHGRPPLGPDDYVDMITYVHPELAYRPAEQVKATLAHFYERREHLSVWTAAYFRDFLVASFSWAGVTMTPEYEVLSDANRLEYFGVWVRS